MSIDIMKENNLIASVALFSELYNSETYTSIPDILAEFIKGAVVYENRYSFTSTDLTELLKNIYGFEIPESVVRNILSSKFKTELKRENNIYHFNESVVNGLQKINQEYSVIENNQKEIIDRLNLFIEKKEKRNLSDFDKKEIFENFTHFLMDNGYSDKYSNEISAFVISNEKDLEFKNNLNSIREGVILYQGINFTADFNQLGKWNTELTIYLGTEHLFNALGYNGILFKEIFNDFYNLVKEINNSSSSKNINEKSRKKIELKYFEETRDEIDYFFTTAESIKKGYKQLDPSKLAMENILKGCESPSDIKAKRIKFSLELKQMGIHLQEFTYDYNKIQKFNVEDNDIIESLKSQSLQRNKFFNEEECRQYFKIFTKVNTYREGSSNKSFEKIGHLFVTEKGFAKYLAHNNIVKFEQFDIAFAKDIDYVTTRFWFALKKGFSDKQTLPKSFDVVNKARIILSSHINTSVSSRYEKLIQEKREGKLSNEEALERSALYREKPNTPEDITIENVDIALDFLNNEEYLEDFYREKKRKDSLMSEMEKHNKELLDEIQRRDNIEKDIKQAKITEEFNKAKGLYVSQGFKDYRKKQLNSVFFLASVFFLNLTLTLFAILVAVVPSLKLWLAELGLWQILTIVSYALIIVVEILGSKYIFDKEKLKNGWLWLLKLLNKSNKLDFDSKLKKELEEKFIDIELEKGNAIE